MEACASLEELKCLVSSDRFDFRFDCGYGKAVSQLQLSDKTTIINSIWLHYVFFLPHAEIEQLRKGFRETLQVELLICLHPNEMRTLLSPNGAFNITASFLLDSFAVNYSETGTHKRTLEEAVMVHWSDYVTECEDNGM